MRQPKYDAVTGARVPSFNDYRKGDDWDGRLYKFPFDLTGASVLVQFRSAPLKPVIFQFSTVDNTIEIPDPSNGEIYLRGRKLEYAVGTYFYDVQITFADGRVKTYAEDKLSIFQDISK